MLIFCFRDATYDDFLADLTHGGETECRYGLYDFEYMYHAQGTDAPQQVLFFILGYFINSRGSGISLVTRLFLNVKRVL